MCLQTAIAVASIGLKVVEGVQANKAAKRDAAISNSGDTRQTLVTLADSNINSGDM